MAKDTVIQSDSFKIFLRYFNKQQLYLTAVIFNGETDPIIILEEIYQQIGALLKEQNMRIVQERLFGCIDIQPRVLEARKRIFASMNYSEESIVTYIQGTPLWGKGFAGIQIHAVKHLQSEMNVWTIYDGTIPCGRAWKIEDATFYLLQDLHGFQTDNINGNSCEEQTARMIDRANLLLQKEGLTYRNAVRTWIYLKNILSWYEAFNLVRNKKYQELHLIPTQAGNIETEQIYLPASTGIEGDNPHGACSVMDLLAVRKESGSPISITHNTGLKQRSPYRYGSAFSRSMTIRYQHGNMVYISGTASIDEDGRSDRFSNPDDQIHKTLDVVNALIQQDGASLQNICQATVFLKRREDVDIYNAILKQYHIEQIPAICVLADVCRDDLLFEIDGVALTENTISLNGSTKSR